MLAPLAFTSLLWASLIEKHKHPALRQHAQESNLGQRMAELIAQWLGTWHAIIAEGAFWGVWLLCNTLPHIHHWDPAPFNLANFLVSGQAACTVLIVLQATNRQEDRDRALAEHHYTETQTLQHMETENTELTQSVHKLLELNNDLTEKMSELTKEIHATIGKERI